MIKVRNTVLAATLSLVMATSPVLAPYAMATEEGVASDALVASEVVQEGSAEALTLGEDGSGGQTATGAADASGDEETLVEGESAIDAVGEGQGLATLDADDDAADEAIEVGGSNADPKDEAAIALEGEKQAADADAKDASGAALTTQSDAAATLSAKVRAHGKTWRAATAELASFATLGKAKATAPDLELVKLSLELSETTGGISYKVYSANKGWQGWKKNGKAAGTKGEAAQAVRIKLTDDAASAYDVYYRVYVKGAGWLAWAKNGELAGMTDSGKTVKAIQVGIVDKGADVVLPSPDSAQRYAYKDRGFVARAYMKKSGWTARKTGNKVTIGSAKKGRAIYAVSIDRPAVDVSGKVEYRVRTQSKGWQRLRSNGAVAGTAKQSDPVEAVRIRLTGRLNKRYDVWYRAYVSTYGWLEWTRNWSVVGTARLSASIECLQVALVEKGGAQPGGTSSANVAFLNKTKLKAASVSYSAHQDGAWTTEVGNGATAGRDSGSKSVKGISARIDGMPIRGSIKYCAYVSGDGWQSWKADGAYAGDLENDVLGVRFKLTGKAAKSYKVYYRVYDAKSGWRSWTFDGGTAGSTLSARPIQAFQVRVVPRSSNGTWADDLSTCVDAADYGYVTCSVYSCGYSQPKRKHISEKWLESGKAETDCSAGVSWWLYKGGLLDENPWFYTAIEIDYLKERGFTKLPAATTVPQRNDVLWRKGHTGLYIGKGKVAQARRTENHTAGWYGSTPGDQDGGETESSPYDVSAWTYILRPPAA